MGPSMKTVFSPPGRYRVVTLLACTVRHRPRSSKVLKNRGGRRAAVAFLSDTWKVLPLQRRVDKPAPGFYIALQESQAPHTQRCPRPKIVFDALSSVQYPHNLWGWCFCGREGGEYKTRKGNQPTVLCTALSLPAALMLRVVNLLKEQHR